MDGPTDGRQALRRLPRLERPFGQRLGQRAPLHEVHREKVLAVDLARVVDRHDIRMPQTAGRLGLGMEAADVVGEASRLERIILMATRRSRSVCRARKTTPMPPRPISSNSSYLPNGCGVAGWAAGSSVSARGSLRRQPIEKLDAANPPGRIRDAARSARCARPDRRREANRDTAPGIRTAWPRREPAHLRPRQRFPHWSSIGLTGEVGTLRR